MSAPTPDKRIFIADDLSTYERISPDEFPDYDAVDSRVIVDLGEPPPNRESADGH